MRYGINFLFFILCIMVLMIGAEIWFLFVYQETSFARESHNLPVAVRTVDDFKWSDEKSKWSVYMDIVGPEAGYRGLKKSYEHEVFMVQHSAIHLFGALFYEKFGLKGIRYCDNSFGFGCFHSFFATASSKEGNNMLFDLDKECDRISDRVDVFTCQHGIGHSLLAHGQMSDKELLNALGLCDTLSHKEPISGCKSGAFMEYNFRSMASIERAGAMTMRSFDIHAPYAPCSWLPDVFLEACHFAQTQWWDNVLDHDYARMGKLCAAITNEKYLISCFMGVGNVASEYVNYDVPSVITICKKMPMKKGAEECLVNASWTFWSESRLRDKVPEICKQADEAVRIRCAGNNA